MDELIAAISSIAAPVVYFPVRHHSPACARMVRLLIESLRPASVLIEGPYDYNPHLSELMLPHQLPIAIYSYVERYDPEDPSLRKRSGAYYPFCIYSPEWQAMQTAHRLGIPFRFIDLPWGELLDISATQEAETPTAQRYADGELRHSAYIAALCQHLGVEDFDALWDTLFEIDPALTPQTYMERAHQLCTTIRATDPHIPHTDLERERFMAAHIRETRAVLPPDSPILVVTGGFHSSALYRLNNDALSDDALSNDAAFDPSPNLDATSMPDGSSILTAIAGIALTPYSYARLDSLTGYEAGMPNPGFYDCVWKAREQKNVSARSPHTKPTAPYRALLSEAVTGLRALKQTISTADLIAVETMAQGLARFRAHAEVWRTDLIDGVIAALIKDERETGIEHPFLQALYGVFRGNKRGHLAQGTRLPPLVLDIQNLLATHDLEAKLEERTLKFNLHLETDRERSRILHRMRLLSLSGYRCIGGTDFTARQDLIHLWEEWSLRWSPEFEGGCIEAAVYGPTLVEAVANRIGERVRMSERDAEVVAIALLDAAQTDTLPLMAPFHDRLIGLIREESDLFRLARALNHLLYLYRYDEAFGSTGDLEVGTILAEAFERGLWLLEGIGQIQDRDREQVEAIRLLLEICERCTDVLPDARVQLIGVLERISRTDTYLPILRGACAGALWTLGAQQMEGLLLLMSCFAAATELGDYLTGLFTCARETAQRQPELLLHLDALLSGYDGEEFLLALPSLRLAFSFFTPREKYYLAQTLMQARKQNSKQVGEQEIDWSPLAPLTVDAMMAAQTMALESRLYIALKMYGIRGDNLP